MTTSSRLPATDRILRDLAPVRRLAPPWKRGLAVCAVGALVALAVFVRFGVRPDADELGRFVVWGLSLLQACFGLTLIVCALRESVPGRVAARRAAWMLLAAGAGLVLTITLVTWSTHASHVPPGFEGRYWAVCFRTPLVVGLPSLLIALVLAFRAYPTRPAVTGALAGLGAGLLSDGSWRTFCEVTDPVHVVSSHLASIAVLTLIGMALAVGWAALEARVKEAGARRG